LSSTCIHVDDFGDLKALLPLADPDFYASALSHAAVARRLEGSCMDERIGAACHGDKPKTLLGIEPLTIASTDSDGCGAPGLGF
jgi:hypothetical protein